MVLRKMFPECVGLLLKAGALGGFRADVQQADLGFGPPQDLLGVVGAHEGELKQVFGGAFGGRAAVD